MCAWYVGLMPAEARQHWDMRAALGRILDGSGLDEFKALYGLNLKPKI